MIGAVLTTLVSIAVLGLAASGESRAGAADGCAPPPGLIVYRVVHEGDEVGRLEIAIRTDGAATVIHTVIDIEITLAYVIPVLDYRHESTEIWRDGGFERFDGVTVDNGREHVITMVPEGDGLRLLKAGDPPAVHDAALLSWIVWCEAALEAGRLLNPLKGRVKEFTAQRARDAATTFEGALFPVRRYDLEFSSSDGSDVRSGAVWYDADGIVAAFTFPTKRGTRASLIRVAPGG